MPEQSVEEFVASTAQKDGAAEDFVLETSELLEVNLRDLVWAKIGSMIAYTGNVGFEREGALDHGLRKFIKKKLTGEGAPLMKMEGQGRVYLADRKKKITVMGLEGDSITVNGNDLLAMERGVDWDIEMMKGHGSMMSGGLFNVKLSGHGAVAITSHGKPLTLKVDPDSSGPIITDPQATVAWSGGLNPQMQTDVSFKSLFGRGSGEEMQLRFAGTGWVVVQPSEEAPFQQGQQQGGRSSTGQDVLGQILGG